MNRRPAALANRPAADRDAVDLDAPAPPLAAGLDGVLNEFAALPGAEAIAALDGAQLLLERMRCTGARVRDGCSTSGACRFLSTANGTLAVNLPRPSDWELLPAWLEARSEGVPPSKTQARSEGVPPSKMQYSDWTWPRVAAAVRSRAGDALLDRARLLGLAVAAADSPPASYRAVCTAHQHGDGAALSSHSRPSSPPRPPRVVDLSALWAGPLCAHLLWLCGAEIIKVEAQDRPDGARFGNAAFHALLNQGKRCVAIDFASKQGPLLLRRLIERADIVIESSRPRALRQLGIDAEAWVRGQAGRTWISITGYGRGEPAENWTAFGDDAGAAAGLAGLMREATGSLQFAGDAIADPLTGVEAARVGWESWLSGGSRLISLSLAGVAAHRLGAELDRVGRVRLVESFGRWWHRMRDCGPVTGIAGRAVRAPVSGHGEDTAAVLGELGISC